MTREAQVEPAARAPLVSSRFARAALPYAAVAMAACAWGTWPLVLRHAEAVSARPLPSALEATIGLAVTSAFAGLTAIRDRVPKPAPWRARGWIAWLGVGDALNMLLFFAAYKLTVGVAVLSHYLTPIIVAVSSPFLLRERLTARTAIAVGVSFAGLALMVGVLGPAHGGAGAAIVLESAALGAGSAVFYASNVITNKFVADAFSTSETMFWHGVVGTPLLAAFVPRGAWAGADPHALVFLAVASIGPGALAGIAFVWGLRRMPAAHASTLTLLEPLVAVVLGAAVFGEDLGLRTATGAALILAGAVVVMTGR
ncbi:MAG TPA: DMT family transporter [Polyangiaceae bacterium]|nr:DMT family transporter [Polyangiaceae bacterium]